MKLALTIEHIQDNIKYNQKCVIDDISTMSNDDICKYLDELKKRMADKITEQTQIRNTDPKQN